MKYTIKYCNSKKYLSKYIIKTALYRIGSENVRHLDGMTITVNLIHDECSYNIYVDHKNNIEIHEI